MFLSLFHALVYDPIYNALIFLVAVLPYGDVGFAIIVLTIFVKLILFPLSLKAARTQLLVRDIEPKLKEIREKYKNSREEQARKTLELYREKGINPFATLFLAILQIPIILGLYLVFFYEKLPEIDISLLYSFTLVPDSFNLLFLGFINVTEISFVLALLAGITQYIQVRYAVPKPLPRKDGEMPTFTTEFARSMHLQMQYVLPLIIFGVSYYVAAAIPLYFIVSNLFAIGQELYLRRTIKNNPKTEAALREEPAL
jgi:YidC/Oxa1 family membrane protein insertase